MGNLNVSRCIVKIFLFFSLRRLRLETLRSVRRRRPTGAARCKICRLEPNVEKFASGWDSILVKPRQLDNLGNDRRFSRVYPASLKVLDYFDKSRELGNRGNRPGTEILVHRSRTTFRRQPVPSFRISIRIRRIRPVFTIDRPIIIP